MNSKEDLKEKEQALLDLTGSFCAQELDDDYYQLCEKVVKKLGRKKDVPFKRGKLEIWAAAVVYAVGSINFLFDKSFEPYVSAEQISEYFGTKNSTVSNKARQIKDMFDMFHFSPEFSTNKMAADSPMNTLVMVDGLIAPLSSLPPDLQEMVREARANGEDIMFQTKQG